jgi:hypothetical protein
MTKIQIRALARSSAGHDRGKLYAVVGEGPGYVQLCDGKVRPLDRPKKKNVKHVQLIVHLPGEMADILMAGSDADVVHLLRTYRKYRTQEEA